MNKLNKLIIYDTKPQQLNMFKDGLVSLTNKLANQRSGLATNTFSYGAISNSRLPPSQLRAMYKEGLVNKIIRLKANSSLADTLQFGDLKDKDFYQRRLSHLVKEAVMYMLGFGRGIITIHNEGDDLAEPLDITTIDKERCLLRAFSGDLVTVMDVSIDFNHHRYMKPMFYNVRGNVIHYSRVIDFTYVKPSHFELPIYYYGGISEAELIYNQVLNDSILQRASSAIVEKSSNFIIKYKGFNDAMASHREDDILKRTSLLEDARSIYGAVVLDQEDDASVLTQNLSNLQDVDNITLRRLAMVCDIPLAY